MKTSIKNKKHRNKTRRRRGGRKIGEGISGKVFTPPLICDDGGVEYNSEEYVSKLTSRSVAESEYLMAEKLRPIDPESIHTVYAIKICKARDVQIDPEYAALRGKDWLVVMKNGGKSLLDASEKIEYLGYGMSNEQIDVKFLNKFLQKLYELGMFLIHMNDSGLFHNDIHVENMVWDYMDGNIRFIDFERSSNKPSNNDIRMVMFIILQVLKEIGMRKDMYTVSPFNLHMKTYSQAYTLEQYKEDLVTVKNVNITSLHL